MSPLRVGARTSPLARVQADWVSAQLTARGVGTEFVGVLTTGDVDQRELTQIGGTGVFVGAVRSALVRGTIDVGVHSLKDLPTGAEPGLQTLAVPAREDVRDVLVGSDGGPDALAGLPAGARIGTGSPRRAVQLQDWARELGLELEVVPVRGNVDTRIGHVAEGRLHATVLAAAGLRRLGRLQQEEADGSCRVVSGSGSLPATLVPQRRLLPAAGQGALALEVAVGAGGPGPVTGAGVGAGPDELAAVAALDDPATRARVEAERSFLATLEAGCLAPVGVLATVSDVARSADSQPQDLTLEAVVGRTVGSEVARPTDPELLRVSLTGPVVNARRVGIDLAEQVLTERGLT